MTLTSKASTTWNGNLFQGSGQTTLESSGKGTFDVNWKARTEDGTKTTNPEELLAAAHATCFSMAFSNELDSNGTPPTKLETTVEVTFDTEGGPKVTGSHIIVRATIDGISEEDFQRVANAAMEGCPVSQALKAIDITLDATLA
ncbi:OsmC family peroxiredoxin [Georgenia subflava]|uniref:OsmC family peroxiredoxin n=1 Tax=Georgenia subflava TaxID=1622177 RepID=A0A6N7EHM3_9MICO|nr:OsmC family peroxiredoxin [Georgenia subflava]MPV37629.1 OsmC family peroxiredoxin [Georgenia subflava]